MRGTCPILGVVFNRARPLIHELRAGVQGPASQRPHPSLMAHNKAAFEEALIIFLKMINMEREDEKKNTILLNMKSN